MTSKLIIFTTLIALASAASRRYGHESSSAQSVQGWEQQREEVDDSQHAEPNYSYSYVVRDDKSGDRKSQHESRQGDQVRGQYRMMESDGTERIVDYSADDRNGFNAVVRHQPEQHQHPVPILVAVHAVPIQADVAAVGSADQIVSNDRQQRQEATSQMHLVQYYAPQSWMISNHVRHN
ncbi:AAEL013511-PA [Aedes aegypti]|uniref:AAEL013511-PA n=2 Tax=Aedes aegypti TaxID=7159 RepID=A0A1S4FZF9_AEDAE|nr:pupal cuticle protein Edg-84A [Aedes aegypti]EAT34226.1 AAEL013511-PA [Aedes aegypti]